MIPQIIIIVLGAIGIGINIAKHGKKKTNMEYNVWAKIIAIAILWTILYYGGFWDVLITK